MKLKSYNLEITIGYHKLKLNFELSEMSLIGLTIRTLCAHIVEDQDDVSFVVYPVYEESIEEAEDEDEAESDKNPD